MFSGLAVLVKLQLFKVIEIYFLPKGHSHDDQDQVFSRLSVYLKTHPARTISELQHCFTQCYDPTPIPLNVTRVADIGSWIAGKADFTNIGFRESHSFV